MPKYKIVYIIDKKEIEIQLEPGRTLLDGALMNQLGPPYMCLEGTCKICEATILEGEVTVLAGSETNDHPRRVKTCHSFPKSSFVKVKYDLD